jgi:hypothetical protein
MKRWITLILSLVLLVACLPTNILPSPDPTGVITTTPFHQDMPPTNEPPANPYVPQPDDKVNSQGNVYLDVAQIRVLESYPVQIVLTLQGNLPTPCHTLRVRVNPPDEQNRITIEVYSLTDPAKTCAQMLKPFDANIPLGSFPAGHYTVWVNGEKIGEFDS